MITLVIGDDAYKRRLAVERVVAASTVAPERIDGAELQENQLADSIAGATLFSTARLVVVTDLSQNKPVWEKLGEWVARVSDDTTLVLVEAKPDKRTKAYKAISAKATIVTAEPWTDRDAATAKKWLNGRAEQLGVALAPQQQAMILQRSTAVSDRPGGQVIDQQQIENALQSLSLVDTVTDEAIAAVLPESHSDNVFTLLEVAMGGDAGRTRELLAHLQMSADPYLTFGFIASQWSQLVAVKVTGADPATLAPQIGISPYALQKAQRQAGALSVGRVGELTELLARLDITLKTTGADPWVVIDRFVGELAKK